MMVRAMVVLAVVLPEVPVTVTVARPVVAVAEAVNVSTEVAVPLAGGVTGLVANAAVTPVGNPVTLSVVAALKLFWLATVMVLVPAAPWLTARVAGAAATVKPGVPAPTVKTRSSWSS